MLVHLSFILQECLTLYYSHFLLLSTAPFQHPEIQRVNCCTPCQFMSETNRTSTYFCQHLNYIVQDQHFVQVWRFAERTMAPPANNLAVVIMWRASCLALGACLWNDENTCFIVTAVKYVSPCHVRLDINHHHGKISFATAWHNSCDKNTACSLFKIGTQVLIISLPVPTYTVVVVVFQCLFAKKWKILLHFKVYINVWAFGSEKEKNKTNTCTSITFRPDTIWLFLYSYY